jgi:ABC-type multidrug transport system permease subunit
VLKHNPLYQLTLLKMRSMLREPEALFWVFAFPLLLALALGVAFRSGVARPLAVGVETGEGADWVVQALSADPNLRTELLSAEQAESKLRAGQVALVVQPGTPWVLWFDPTRPESRLAELGVNDALQRAAGRQDARPTLKKEMTEKGSRYIDFLIPGLVGLNLMGTGMWGIGFYVVNARSRKILKRLVATPMRRSDYLLSQMTGRLVFLVFEVGVLVGFGRLVFDVPQRGSWLALAGVSLIGALAFAGLGLFVAARPRSIEGVSGLMNLVMMPMWIGSGTFFSTARFPEVVQPVIQALPLTAVNDALRAVMLDGASLAAVAGELAIALAWGAIAFLIALATFRWQ